MLTERYNYLSENVDAKLSEHELNQGWHFCWDWDLMLVNAIDEEGEGEHCACYSNEDKMEVARYVRDYKPVIEIKNYIIT